MQKETETNESTDKEKPVYLSIDHLKDGNYIFNIILDNKIVKSIKLKK